MFPLSHKTVVVLDHTPYFGISSESRVELELSRGLRQPPHQSGQSPHPPQLVTKSLWTCSVEAAIEYCRIVWDLFPQGKLVNTIIIIKQVFFTRSQLVNLYFMWCLRLILITYLFRSDLLSATRQHTFSIHGIPRSKI